MGRGSERQRGRSGDRAQGSPDAVKGHAGCRRCQPDRAVALPADSAAADRAGGAAVHHAVRDRSARVDDLASVRGDGGLRRVLRSPPERARRVEANEPRRDGPDRRVVDNAVEVRGEIVWGTPKTRAGRRHPIARVLIRVDPRMRRTTRISWPRCRRKEVFDGVVDVAVVGSATSTPDAADNTPRDLQRNRWG